MKTAWIITRDGRPTYGRYATQDGAFAELLSRVPYSVDHATKHEGYGFAEVPADRWSDPEAHDLRATANRVLSEGHSHGSGRPFERDNCAACALSGYGAVTDGAGRKGYNYAGWERLFTQTRRTLAPQYRAAYLAAFADSDNPSYVEALKMDVRTFGPPPGVTEADLLPYMKRG